jgi:putative transposase
MAKRFTVPDGWTARGYAFEVEWPDDPAPVWSHFGARRKAFNWALGQVKADMDARKADPAHPSVRWDFRALRDEWNQVKRDVAPWWAENSKEAYATGIADLCAALDNWKASRTGERKGRKAGFPKFRSRRKDRNRVRFTTGAIHVKPDRRTITLPVLGDLRSKESTRRLERLTVSGKARILSATLTERWGRLFVSFSCVVRQQRPAPAKLAVRCGVDLGLRRLATVADSDGVVFEVPNPAPLRATLTARRKAGRQMSRRITGSRGWRDAKAKLARLDRRCVHLRKEASHQLTTRLAGEYGEIVVEDLDLAAMKRSMGRRAFRRSVSDAALGQIRPQLAYKTAWHGGKLTVADRWFASSQIHHGCGCRLAGGKLDEWKTCTVTGVRVHRDRNAALNLRDWPETHASLGAVDAQAPPGKPGGQDTGPPGAVGGHVRPAAFRRLAVSGEARTSEPREGVPAA